MGSVGLVLTLPKKPTSQPLWENARRESPECGTSSQLRTQPQQPIRYKTHDEKGCRTEGDEFWLTHDFIRGIPLIVEEFKLNYYQISAGTDRPTGLQ
jgi:hypothetical protein